MSRPRLYPFHFYVILTFVSVSFPTVTPQRLASLGTYNNISKLVQNFQQKLPPVLDTLETPLQNLPHELSAKAIKRDLHSIRPSRTPLNVGSRSILTSVHEQSTQLRVSSRQSGLNFDTCESDSECAGSRICFELTSGAVLIRCNSGPDCFCRGANPVDVICKSDSDCDDGESCIEIALILVCVSDNAGSKNGDGDSSSARSSSSGSGLNFKSCKNDSDCAAPRRCLDSLPFRQSARVISCSSGPTCACLSTNLGVLACASDEECEDGENCVSVDSVEVCVSDNNILGIKTSTSGTEAICIGSDSLTHLAKEDLVFEHDALAHVLCDANESCATPGHMVVYMDEALMMKSYCELVGCTRKVKRVNSPKYVRRLTVPSATRDLVFTAFAARFGTVVEEGVLSVAVRVGL